MWKTTSLPSECNQYVFTYTHSNIILSKCCLKHTHHWVKSTPVIKLTWMVLWATYRCLLLWKLTSTLSQDSWPSPCSISSMFHTKKERVKFVMLTDIKKTDYTESSEEETDLQDQCFHLLLLQRLTCNYHYLHFHVLRIQCVDSLDQLLEDLAVRWENKQGLLINPRLCIRLSCKWIYLWELIWTANRRCPPSNHVCVV